MNMRLFIAGILLGCCMACNNSDDSGEELPESGIDTSLFATDDGSKSLPADYVSRFNLLLKATDPEKMATNLNGLAITDAQYQEIKHFVEDSILSMASTEEDPYRTIFSWVATNVEYNDPLDPSFSNDAYAVFKNRRAVCQGYTNLLKVMLHSCDIPVVSVGGFLHTGGHDIGHAWNYVYINGNWRMADATNNYEYPIEDARCANNKPTNADIDLFENESVICNYHEGHLNVRAVKSKDKQWSFPFGIAGFHITSFNPNQNLPTEIEEIYLSKNVVSLGEGLIGLNVFENRLKRIHVDGNNPQLTGIHGIVYHRYSTQQHDGEIPYLIPAYMDTIVLKPNRYIGKGTVTNHNHVKVLVISEGTQTIEAYAVERCPALQEAHIPASVKTIDPNAFYQMENIRIIHHE